MSEPVFVIPELDLAPDPTPMHLHVYYDRFGIIRGVGRPDPEMAARYESIELPVAEVEPFLTGERSTADWFVGEDQDGKRSLCSNIRETREETAPDGPLTKVRLSSIDERPVAISDGVPGSPVTLVIRVGIEDRMVRFIVERNANIEIESEEEKLAFFFVKKSNPTIVYRQVIVEASDLFGGNSPSFPLNFDPREGFMVITARLFEDYRVETKMTAALRMPLPQGRFNDILWAKPVDEPPTTPCLMIALDRSTSTIILSLIGDGGPIYDRDFRQFPLILCRDRTPERIEQMVTVDITTLVGQRFLTLPLTAAGRLSAYMPLAFHQVCLYDPGY